MNGEKESHPIADWVGGDTDFPPAFAWIFMFLILGPIGLCLVPLIFWKPPSDR